MSPTNVATITIKSDNRFLAINIVRDMYSLDYYNHHFIKEIHDEIY